MFENSTLLLGIATLLAAIPIAVWLYITIKKEPHSKKIMLAVFGLGCLTAPALLALQWFWEENPNLAHLLGRIGIENIPNFININFNLVEVIEKTFKSPETITILTLILFAALEENIKLYVMRKIDNSTLYIAKINDAMRYCIAAALGFSFAENVYYLYAWWPMISTGELAGMYFFRSIFTTAAHMVYTGIFGYYYGIGKFSMIINKENLLEGKKDHISEFMAKIFNLPPSEGFRQKCVLKGLFIATGMHFTINYMLELQQAKGIQILFPLVILTNIAMYMFLQYLLNRKAGHLILLSDPSTKKTASIAKKDEDVVIELVSMWLQDKRYVDVIHICERLLERDPDNSVVKLFKAKAMDAMDDKNIYKKILSSTVKTDDELSGDEKSIISKYVTEKEMFKKVQAMIKEKLKKEGKEFIDVTKTEALKPEISPVPTAQEKKPDILQKLTGDGTFKL